MNLGPAAAVPCPSYDGHRVRWDRWETSPVIVCARVQTGCETCGHRGSSLARGVLEIPASEHWRLTAFRCHSCGRIDIIDTEAMTTPHCLLCDGCDCLCGVGVDMGEARSNLLALGGWTAGGDADWDLCPACNPSGPSAPSPRSIVDRLGAVAVADYSI